MSIPQEHDYIGLSEPLHLPKSDIHKTNASNLTGTDLRLGLPGSQSPERDAISVFGNDSKDETKPLVSGAKRGFSDAITWGLLSINGGSESNLGQNAASKSCLPVDETSSLEEKKNTAPASKAQVVGWPPIRSFRKNTMAANKGDAGFYVKVAMDGAPYLRKIDLKTYSNYTQLSSALENMFSCFTIGQYEAEKDRLSESHLMDLLHGSEYVLTYEDKDGDWMLVGDVPWEMFTDSCKRLRIMKGSDAIGLAPRAMQKSKSQN